MSRLDSVRRFFFRQEENRQEATTRVPAYTDRRNEPTNYSSNMITGAVWNISEESDQGLVGRYDPLGYNITFGFARSVYDPWFKFVDPEDKSKEIMKDVQDELRRLDAKKWFTLALAYERIYGYSYMRVVNVGRTDYRVDTMSYDEGSDWILDVFSPEHVKVGTYDDFGRPKTLLLTLPDGTAEGGTKVVEEPASDFIIFRTRPVDRSHKGLPATAPSWDYMAYLRLTFNSIANYAQKIGLGAFVVISKGPLKSELSDSIRNTAQSLNTNKYALFDAKYIEDIKFVGAAGSSVNFQDFINAFLQQAAAGAMIPKNILTGDSTGSIAGSEIGSQEAYTSIIREQGEQVRYIREVVYKLGFRGKDYLIEWNTRYATDEKEKAQVEVTHVSANVARLQYMTINEVRALDNLPPIEGGDEPPSTDDYKASFDISERPKGPEQLEQTHNPQGANT